MGSRRVSLRPGMRVREVELTLRGSVGATEKSQRGKRQRTSRTLTATTPGLARPTHTNARASTMNEPSIPSEGTHNESTESVFEPAPGLGLNLLDERLARHRLELPGDGIHLDRRQWREDGDESFLVRAKSFHRLSQSVRIKAGVVVLGCRKGHAPLVQKSERLSARYAVRNGMDTHMLMPSMGETSVPRYHIC